MLHYEDFKCAMMIMHGAFCRCDSQAGTLIISHAIQYIVLQMVELYPINVSSALSR